MGPNNLIFQKIQMTSLLVLTACALSACSQVSFSPAGNDSLGSATSTSDGIDSGQPPIGGDGSGGLTPIGGDGNCIPAVADIVKPTKILFLVDTTGSNSFTSNIYDTNGSLLGEAPPTDPTMNFRYNAISQFINQYSSKSNFKWGVVTFAKTNSNSGAVALVNNGNAASPRFNSAQIALQAMNSFKSANVDEGNTHYTPAMAMAAKAIKEDPDFGNSYSQYFVILVSDGMPNDPAPNVYNSARITELTGIAPGRVKVSAVFYTALPSSSPLLTLTRSYLKDLVSRANGIYGEVTSTGSSIANFSFNDIIPGTPGDANCKRP